MLKHPAIVTFIFLSGFLLGRLTYQISHKAFAVSQKENIPLEPPLEILNGYDDNESTDALTPQFEPIIQINLERSSVGLSSIDSDNRLICAAQRHADAIAGTGKCSHQVEKEADLATRVRKCGYTNSKFVELLSCQVTSGVVDAWMADIRYREKILNQRFRKIGCGGNGAYWVCVLARD
jgi:uncharacterized protein YkwD